MPKKEDLKNEVDDNKEEASKEVVNETETKTKEKKASKKETKKVESNKKEIKTSKEPEVDEATVIEKIKNFIAKIREKHDGMMMCADLLRANAERGGIKKQHCDKMVYEAIEILETLLDGQEQ